MFDTEYKYMGDMFFLKIPTGETVPSNFHYYPQIPSREEAQRIIALIEQFYATHSPEQIEAINKTAERWWNRQMYPPHPPKQRRVEAGFVYLIRGVNGAYKIGKTKNPQKRISTLNVKLPFEIEPVCIIQTDDMNNLEAQLHYQFNEKRGNGEWFELDTADIEYIKGLAS